MYKLFLVCLATCFAFASCKSSEEKKAEQLKQEVLELHDELMLQTEKLGKIKKELMQKRSQAKNAPQRLALRGAAELCAAAESFMMDWMNMYSEPDAEQALDKTIAYYEKQKKELRRMEKQMKEAEKKGKKLIDDIINGK